jgi:hypothetical protein
MGDNDWVIRSWLYVLTALALILFGIAGLFSIGAPFFLTGLVMLICFPWRRDRAVLVPALSAVWGFTIGYILVAPLGCSSSAFGPPERAHPLGMGVLAVGQALVRRGTVCNGVLFDYSGGGSYSPPLLPALIAGLAAGLIVAIVVRRLLRRGKTAKSLPPCCASHRA